MRRLLSFAVVLFIVITIYIIATFKSSREGFVVNPLDPTGENAAKDTVKMPPPPGTGPTPTQLPVSQGVGIANAVPSTPSAAQRDVTGVLPSELPGGLPTAPYQAIARNSPYPYQDPSLVKTTRARILEVLERVKGFLAFQAPEIEESQDPRTQLPLMTARSATAEPGHPARYYGSTNE